MPLPSFMRKPAVAVILLYVFSMQVAVAGEVLIAVAANFSGVLQQLAPVFHARTGHSLRASTGASGTLAMQIENGAPYQVFLSADAERPEALEAAGAGVKGTRFTYARGKLVLWSNTPRYVDSQGKVLRAGDFRKIAVANPKTAPYGRAALEVLQKLGLWNNLGARAVQGENISQTFQFIESGNAELGFIAYSQLLSLDASRRGSSWEVPADLYRPIEQQAILLKSGENSPAARAFLRFLKSDEARKIIKACGYDA